MKTNHLHTIMGVAITAFMVTGGAIGIYLAGSTTDEFSWDLMVPIIIGSVGGMAVFAAISKWRETRNGDVPEYDERTVKNLQKYFMFVLYFLLVGSGLALLIAFTLGVKTIETGLLIFILACLFILILVGGMVVKQI